MTGKGSAAKKGQGGAGELRAVDGRVPGRRGLATRQRLLDHTAELLATTSYRDLTVVDIAREAGTSPATFYQYFPDAESALVALADAVPSPALVLFPEFAPFSTMTWSLDLTAANPTSASGWWLLDSTIDAADGGYASQDMSLWNDAGELVARARQMVAVFI